MAICLDHVIVFCAEGAPEASALIDLGLCEGSPNVHPGQGTANRRFFFQNAFLELLYVCDAAEAQSESVRRLLLWDRWSDRAERCPFGFVVRDSDHSRSARPPFSTWRHSPPYFPPGVALEVASDSPLSEPAVFYLDLGGAVPPAAQPRTKHPLGVGQVTGLAIEGATADPGSEALQALQAHGVLSFRPAREWRMTMTFDDARCGRSANLQPALPLTLEW